MTVRGDPEPSPERLYVCLLSIHGLIRGDRLELGRDADTGGQTKYVVELARAVAEQPGVARVDLVTRLIEDPQVSADYAVPVERLAERAQIVRIAAGPHAYLPKEQLWDYLDTLADNLRSFFHRQARRPDVLHAHYADAGYVGARLSNSLGVPLVLTGHSLGRVKRGRLIASGLTAAQIEERYKLTRRIDAEELALATAERVVTSTQQEIDEQYERYDYYQPEQMRVIPPGVDLARFHPPTGEERAGRVAREIARFLREPDKPMILALSRPDARKNVAALIEAFGADEGLRAAANLVIVAGNRGDVYELDGGSRDVWLELLAQIDRFDLYGRVAYPKRHTAEEVPEFYRLAALTRGVFVNPALTEPFGLTLLEAAASGLPVVATEEGGPREIIANCANGVLVDPLQQESIAAGIRNVLLDGPHWVQRAEAGLLGVRKHYSWTAHAQRYVEMCRRLADRSDAPPVRRRAASAGSTRVSLAIFTDLDQSLLAQRDALPELLRVLHANRRRAAFGIATGRRLDSALRIMKAHGIPEPDVLITSGGTEINYAPDLREDEAWARHIEKSWTPSIVRRVLEGIDGLVPQPRPEQGRFKVSYYIDPRKVPLDELKQRLLREEQTVNVILSFGQFLDILPIRASKGLALRYVAATTEIPLECILAAGGSGADEDMMRGNTLAVVVGNRHREELSQLVDHDRIFFARRSGAAGILEAFAHYDFWGRCVPPAGRAQ